jgi:hypothetical protein
LEERKMIDMVLVRNRHTGREKEVPRGTAEMMENELFLAKDWEVVKPGAPTPHEVIEFQEKVKAGKDPQPLEFVKKDTPEDMIKKAQALIAQAEALKKAEEEKALKVNTTDVVDLATLSVRTLSDKMEYLNLEELERLKADERKSVRSMVEKELKKREDEKNNPGAE